MYRPAENFFYKASQFLSVTTKGGYAIVEEKGGGKKDKKKSMWGGEGIYIEWI